MRERELGQKESSGYPEPDTGGRGRFRGLWLVGVGAAGLLVTAWLLRIEGPRTLEFPRLEPRALFSPLASEPGGVDAGAAPAPSPSRFEAALRSGFSRTPEPDSRGPAAPPVLVIPLGGGLVADLASPVRSPKSESGGTWTWASRGWGTLAIHRAGAGRPDALIYSEPLAPLYARRPSLELLRFQLTAVPVSVVGLPLAEELLAGRPRSEYLASTATAGRGLGFVPAEEGAAGTRWAGRNEHRVEVRMGRFTGAWQEQGTARPDGSTADGATAGGGPAVLPGLSRVPASLFLGHAVSGEGIFGAHLAILCAQEPACPVAEDLTTFLASIRPGAADHVARLRGELPGAFGALAAEAGLELQEPEIDPPSGD